MLMENCGILSIYSDKFLKKCINSYLSKTERGEFINISFNQLINDIFLSNNRDILFEAFKDYDKSLLDDLLWMKAANILIDTKEYLTYSNTGAKYYNLLLIEFVNKNKTVLINEFIIKFCKERKIRESIIKETLLIQKIEDKIIGSILIEALNKENELIKEEESNLEIMFQVRSKEKFTYTLPSLTHGQTYFIKLDEGNGIGYIDEYNVFNYTPPTVGKNTFIKAIIYIVDNNGITIKRHPFKIEILPQKYLRPTFNTYRLKPGTSISVQLEPVEDIYKYKAFVDKGFGSILIDNNFTLIYTAPETNLSQNISVKLELLWNDTIVLYDSIINFNIVLNDGDVDISENISSIGKLEKEVDQILLDLNNMGKNVSDIKKDVDNLNKIENSDAFEVLK